MTNRRKFLLSAVTVPVAATASVADGPPPESVAPQLSRTEDLAWKVFDLAVENRTLQMQIDHCASAAAGHANQEEIAIQGVDPEWSPAYQDVLDLRQKYEELKGKAMSAPSLRNRIVEHAVVNYATTQPTGYEDGLPVRGPLPTPKEVADYAKTLFEELKSLDVPFETQTEA